MKARYSVMLEEGLRAVGTRFVAYTVSTPVKVAVLTLASGEPQDSLFGDDAIAAAEQFLSQGFEVAALLGAEAPGAAIVQCVGTRADAAEQACVAVWALKAQGGWEEQEVSTLMVVSPPRAQGGPHGCTWFNVSRTGDTFRDIEVTALETGGRAMLATAIAALSVSDRNHLVLANVDLMMAYNDAWGFTVADVLLLRVRAAIEVVARRHAGQVLRLTGDGFVVLLATGLADAQTVALEVEAAVDALRIELGHPERKEKYMQITAVAVGLEPRQDVQERVEALLHQRKLQRRIRG